MHQVATWYRGRPHPSGLCVRWESSPFRKKKADRGGSPQFSAHVYCDQTAGWIKIALGMVVGLRPVHIALDATQLQLPKKGAEPPIFDPPLLWPNGWMHQDATWYGGRPQPRRHCVRCAPSYRKKKAYPPLPIFGPSLLWPNDWRRLVRK